ncbi:MAG TPA: nucleotide exchange factor GrpE [Porphyromonadaceae bacterium]|jgi:molecular chaperone GrpE|uniref:nucleotide exchange factor GrpE n=1 Tax=Petrimonas TaxID=307628 RepID=UPI000E874338|nr:nucleotide exchange factor GrpE [Petrimonas sp.]HBC38528.1 nucleotide exchange factor GrpE [Porphyromonadaceae bacterium]MDD4846030.1 nucleotide exchange factor GrpE [Petrimonas sp.]HBK42145.1 nucleotide exchange factor GrpE [Porphyromonadaceae bacterium]HCB89188.1 nucleotide exchange factor GrpE [Porphyromonadaceae bacterium]
MKKNNDYTGPEELYEDDMNLEPAREDKEEVEEQKANVEDNLSDEADPVEELQVKYDDLNDNYLRLHAEFDNFRKRTLKEKADIIKSGGERVLTDMLPFADDFERALQALHTAEDKEAMVEGMDLIYSKFLNFLNQHGVKEIEALGQPFDADKFEAITTVPVQDKSQKGVIIDCVQKGYQLNDKIIRYPKVIVGE